MPPTGDAAAIAAEFDAKAPVYEENRLAGWYQAQAALVLEQLEPAAARCVLDVGCGSGWLLRQLAHREPRMRGIGIDLSPGMVAEARRRAEEEGLSCLEFHHADWERPDELARLPLPDAASPATAVTCVSAFHYFAHPQEALRRMAGCLAPGGPLLLVERAKDASALTHLWDRLHRHWIRDPVRFYARDEILAMLRAAGLHDPRVAVAVRRYFWQKKLYTSLAVLRAERGPASPRPAASPPEESDP